MSQTLQQRVEVFFLLLLLFCFIVKCYIPVQVHRRTRTDEKDRSEK